MRLAPLLITDYNIRDLRTDLHGIALGGILKWAGGGEVLGNRQTDKQTDR